MDPKENDFFKASNIYLSKSHSDKLEKLKHYMIMSNNMYVSKSVFFRAMIDFLYDNMSCCDNMKQYITKNRGKSYVDKFNVLISENKSVEEISEILGVDEKLISKIFDKQE